MKTPLQKLLAAAGLAALPALAMADNFPERPIELIVTYEAGSGADVMGRLIARLMSGHLPNGQQVVVVNRPGGGGTIGMTALTRAEPDGYTFAYTTSSPVTIQPHYGRTTFSIEDLAPIAKVIEVPAALNVHRDSPIENFEQWLEFVRANPRSFTYATTGGTGSGTHLVTEELAEALEVEIRHVPFEGDANSAAALSGGQLMGTMQMPNMHRGGDVRPILFMTSIKPPHPDYADIPTTTELGIPAVADFFAGFFAPAGTPPERIAVLEAALEAAMQEDDIVNFLNNAQFPIVFAGAEEFGEIVAETSTLNRAMLVRLGLIAD
ncbi:MAG: tripartite tricarboxylate transporter substrate binding protein [Pararhodobacter sp.]|nr:tripartite tricarboxylate transporter substrate binding protein [Pararhodobacter sp.]